MKYAHRASPIGKGRSLSLSQVREVRDLYYSQVRRWTRKQLAERFNVSPSTITEVIYSRGAYEFTNTPEDRAKMAERKLRKFIRGRYYDDNIYLGITGEDKCAAQQVARQMKITISEFTRRALRAYAAEQRMKLFKNQARQAEGELAGGRF